MITETSAVSIVSDLLSNGAVTVVATLASSEPLSPGEPLLDGDVDLGELAATGHAVLVPFSGPLAGEFVLVVDDELSTALQDTPLGQLDITSALTPTAEAVGSSLARGPGSSVALGNVVQIDAATGLNQVLGAGHSGLVPLLGGSGIRAVLAISVQAADGEPVSLPSAAQQAAAAAAAAVVSGTADFAPAADRLDVLRGVEMSATAELGRVRMTVNDLLALRDGAVIELDRAAGAPADLYVNGRLIARGEVVVVDENYGLRITQVVTDADNR